uniref:Ycf49-like protein n=1 Tax=Lotus japonicus TaxID=34305 RepID=I3S5L8_LOTJA|nr:unknown [Lotus japonicus]
MAAAAAATLCLPRPCCTPKIPFPSDSRISSYRIGAGKPQQASTKAKAGLSLFLDFVEPASLQLQLHEPSNALSLPTWAVHVSSVVEWIIAMALVWQYGEKSGYEAWKGLSWGMVPLLGGAFCACTWHFFYNDESLEVLVALQAALTLVGNATMCIAAYRIYKSSRESA